MVNYSNNSHRSILLVDRLHAYRSEYQIHNTLKLLLDFCKLHWPTVKFHNTSTNCSLTHCHKSLHQQWLKITNITQNTSTRLLTVLPLVTQHYLTFVTLGIITSHSQQNTQTTNVFAKYRCYSNIHVFSTFLTLAAQHFADYHLWYTIHIYTVSQKREHKAHSSNSVKS